MVVRRHWTETLWPHGVPAPERGSMANQQPSVGRTVHYVAYGTPGGEFPSGVCRAAIITEVNNVESEDCSVMVANPQGLFFNTKIRHDEVKKAPGTWHWPERV